MIFYSVRVGFVTLLILPTMFFQQSENTVRAQVIPECTGGDLPTNPNPTDPPADELLDACIATPTSTEDGAPKVTFDPIGGVSPMHGSDSGTYHWRGAQTENQNFQGVRSVIRVRDPNVTHDDGRDSFFVARLMAKDGGGWIEVGWAEVDWRYGQKIYVYDTASDGGWHFYNQFNLTPGQNIAVALRYNPLTSSWRALLWTSQGWARLMRHDLGFGNAYIEEFGEALVDLNGHFEVGQVEFGSGGVVRLKHSVQSWSRWDTAFATLESNGQSDAGSYETHWQGNKYYDWYMHKH